MRDDAQNHGDDGNKRCPLLSEDSSSPKSLKGSPLVRARPRGRMVNPPRTCPHTALAHPIRDPRSGTFVASGDPSAAQRQPSTFRTQAVRSSVIGARGCEAGPPRGISAHAEEREHASRRAGMRHGGVFGDGLSPIPGHRRGRPLPRPFRVDLCGLCREFGERFEDVARLIWDADLLPADAVAV